MGMVEAGVGDAKSSIANHHGNFIHRLMISDRSHETYAGDMLTMVIEVECPAGVVMCKLQDLGKFIHRLMINDRSHYN